MGFAGRMHEDYRNGSVHMAPTFLFYFGEKKVGRGVFDEYGKPSGEVICLPLLKQKVWEGFAQSKEQYFLWVLLVSPAQAAVRQKGWEGYEEEGYRRVGWGLHFVPSWFDGLAAKTFSLV
jgi:hypothetical protein